MSCKHIVEALLWIGEQAVIGDLIDRYNLSTCFFYSAKFNLLPKQVLQGRAIPSISNDT